MNQAEDLIIFQIISLAIILIIGLVFWIIHLLKTNKPYTRQDEEAGQDAFNSLEKRYVHLRKLKEKTAENLEGTQQQYRFNRSIPTELRAYRLAVTDLFVEKAITILATQAESYRKTGKIAYVVGLTTIISGIVVAGIFYHASLPSHSKTIEDAIEKAIVKNISVGSILRSKRYAKMKEGAGRHSI